MAQASRMLSTSWNMTCSICRTCPSHLIWRLFFGRSGLSSVGAAEDEGTPFGLQDGTGVDNEIHRMVVPRPDDGRPAVGGTSVRGMHAVPGGQERRVYRGRQEAA